MKNTLFFILCAVLFCFICTAPGCKDAKAAIQSNVENSILKVTFRGNPNSGGTGFVLETPNKNKVVITNAHVCAGGLKEGRVVLSGKGLAHPVEMPIIEAKSEEDLCIVQAPSFLPALKLGQAPQLGQHVTVVGHPWLRPLTATDGYIRDMDFKVEFYSEPEGNPCNKSNERIEEVATFFGMTQVCVASYQSYDLALTIYPGNSGSPLLDDRGQVIGVAFATAQGTGMSNALRYGALLGMISVY